MTGVGVLAPGRDLRHSDDGVPAPIHLAAPSASNATFTCPALTTLARLDELDLESAVKGAPTRLAVLAWRARLPVSPV